MAKMIVEKSNFLGRLRSVLRKGLVTAGLGGIELELEPIRGTKLHRVTVVSKGFTNLRPSERQDLVWRIVGAAFTPDEQLQISTIYTFAPEELAG